MKLCYFFKITKIQSPKYLLNNILTVRSTCRTRNIDNLPQFNFRHWYFPSVVIEWDNLDKCIRNSESLSIFKKSILKFIRLSPNRICNCHGPREIKLLAPLRLGLSHLRDDKFKHNFQYWLNTICNWYWDNSFLSPSLLSFFSWKIDSHKQHSQNGQQYFKYKWF